MAFVEQLRAESELVQINLAENNALLAQQHADKAAALLTPNVTREIAERNQRIANDLSTAVNKLKNISLQQAKQPQQLSVSQLENELDAILGEVLTTRIDKEQRVNATILALAFANLVDSILVDYGSAYAVDFDMTNMSNMGMMGGNSSAMMMESVANGNSNSNSNNMNMGSMNMSSMTMNMNSNNRSYTLVDMSDYQSAQALVAKAQEILNNELKPMATNNSSAFITNIENGLIALDNAIQRKSSPMDIMMIVHTQIHPNLLQAFNLKLL